MRRRRTSSVSRRVLRAGTAIAVCGAAAFAAAPPAAAVSPDQLRPNCTWASAADEAATVQTCAVYSAAMNRIILVQIRPSALAAGSAEHAVYLLDGISAPDTRSTWADANSGALAAYSSTYNLVMPAGGAGTWMTDWQSTPEGTGGTPGASAEWETFLSTELPAYLADDFSVEPGGNAIVGLSMSGGPALTLALDHPEIFTVAQSLSGFYQTNNPIGWFVIPAIQSFVTGIANGNTAMWGDPLGPTSTWSAHDVSARIGEITASGQRILISTGIGVPLPQDFLIMAITGNPVAFVSGVAIELGSLASTLALNAQAVVYGLPVDFSYHVGLHSWTQWSANAGADATAVESALAAANSPTTSSTAPRTSTAGAAAIVGSTAVVSTTAIASTTATTTVETSAAVSSAGTTTTGSSASSGDAGPDVASSGSAVSSTARQTSTAPSVPSADSILAPGTDSASVPTASTAH
ncbi:alpha/beta hydrolase family protein [Gordonia sp. L191]|uniref:alpha/beta hydrolase n=1 Tax=Gordonia sp. L191 TaxID=2982699 RepID=UPI0024C0D84B|nr:alpha/beta hydrolase family protein [Gordonia sp. L191]WHU45946.1 alpha/beta hydrolase family protein [Gordonia sp. L191]